MIDPASLQMLRDVVTIFGVIAGFTYYVMTVRNSNKARQTQIWQNMQEARADKVLMLDYVSVLHYEFADYNEYRKKYNWYTNQEEWAKLASTGHRFDGIGFMMNKGVVNPEDVYDYGGDGITRLWYRYREIVQEMRTVGDPNQWQWWEYVVTEMERISDQRGDDLYGLKKST